jgi:hypothetical protein
VRALRAPFAALVAGLVLAGPLVAQVADPQGTLRGALASVGCIMTQDNQDQVLTASGLTEDAATDALVAMIGAGEVLAEGETLRLLSGDCAGVGGDAPDPAVLAARRDRIVAALVARGCRISERESTGFAAELGLPDTELVATLFELVGRGEARIDRSGALESIELVIPPCGGVGQAPAPPTKP